MERSLAALCVAVPSAGTGVCPVCHGWRRPGFELCLSCQRVRRQLTHFCSLVAPVSLCAAGSSPLYGALRGYKSEALGPSRRAPWHAVIAALLGSFLGLHGRCIAERAGGGWDLVTTVPSSASRRGEHPLASLVGRLGAAGPHAELLEPGPAAIGHLLASDCGYLPARASGYRAGFDSRRVLVLDDTFTSGARAQSAASALALAGAEVVAIVPVARMVRPAYGESAAFWARQRRLGFDPARCCLES